MSTGVTVLGLGNMLMGDDGFGPCVIEALTANCDVPPGVTVLDGGTPGLNLLPFVIDTRVLIVIDTVKAKGAPGELRFYEKADLCRPHAGVRHGPHEPGIAEVLGTLELAGRGPSEVVLIGAIPKSTGAGIGLTPTLRAAVPKAADAVIDRLQEFGFTAANSGRRRGNRAR